MRKLVASVVVIAALLVLAGCGSSNASKSDSGSAGATVDLRNNSKLGEILVDAKGRTLYLFEADRSGKSTCNGACATTWPPLTAKTSTPSAGNSVDGGALGTTKRSDGTSQVTYHGHPLYYYAGDGSTAGTAKGEGLKTFGGEWYVVDASGKGVEPQSKSEMGGGGYGY